MPGSIDVVVVAYNRYELTASCLRHLRAQTVEHRVIVVDNGSSDETYATICAEWPDVDLVRFETSRGFAEACNQGVATGCGETVVLLNNDVECEPQFLERLLAPLSDPTVGSVASLMVEPGGEKIDGMGLAADVVLAGFPRLQGLPVARANERAPVLAGAGGSAGAYRRIAWEEVGGLDETIFAYMEDLDLALRLRIAGWRAVAEPEAVGVHLCSATAGYRSAWQRRQAGFGRGYLMRRYGLLRGATFFRALITETIVVCGDLVAARDLAALRGRVAGWRAGRSGTRLPLPPADCLDHGIGFFDSLALRRGIYGRRSA